MGLSLLEMLPSYFDHPYQLSFSDMETHLSIHSDSSSTNTGALGRKTKHDVVFLVFKKGKLAVM